MFPAVRCWLNGAQEWKFSQGAVCVLAKTYLDQIWTHPVLCVGALNPDLYHRVPMLQSLRQTRQRLMQLAPILAQ